MTDAERDAIRKYIDAAVRVAARKEMAAAGALTWRGLWQRAESYQRGEAVTFDGVLWYCCSTVTTDKPGSSQDWQLMHKSARPAE